MVLLSIGERRINTRENQVQKANVERRVYEHVRSFPFAKWARKDNFYNLWCFSLFWPALLRDSPLSSPFFRFPFFISAKVLFYFSYVRMKGLCHPKWALLKMSGSNMHLGLKFTASLWSLLHSNYDLCVPHRSFLPRDRKTIKKQRANFITGRKIENCTIVLYLCSHLQRVYASFVLAAWILLCSIMLLTSSDNLLIDSFLHSIQHMLS